MDKPEFTVIQGGFGKERAEAIQSPDCPVKLTKEEQKIWDYICEQLRAAGMQHKTAGLAISVICKTYISWMDNAEKCAKMGRTQVGGSGNSYEAPWSYCERNDRKELLRWLPQACLTIPSFAKAKAMESGPQQDDLFDEIKGFAEEHPG